MTPEEVQALKDEPFVDQSKAKAEDSVPLSALTQGVVVNDQETAMNVPGKVPEPITEYQGHGKPSSVYNDMVEEYGGPTEGEAPSEGVLDHE
jgi:hypothetical protein